MSPPVVTLNEVTVKYRINFVEASTGGNNVVISAYDIEILNKDGVSWSQPTGCEAVTLDGFGSGYCDVDQSVLASEFLFVQQDAIVARIRAQNEIGWSEYSGNSNDDILMVELPH